LTFFVGTSGWYQWSSLKIKSALGVRNLVLKGF